MCYHEEEHKKIHCVSINDFFWITKTQMFDIIFRDGWTLGELASLEENIPEIHYLARRVAQVDLARLFHLTTRPGIAS